MSRSPRKRDAEDAGITQGASDVNMEVEAEQTMKSRRSQVSSFPYIKVESFELVNEDYYVSLLIISMLFE